MGPRKDSSGADILYRATDGNTYPAYWRPEYHFFTYWDIRDGKEHPIWYEHNVSLEDLEYANDILYNREFLKTIIKEEHEKLME